MDDPKRILRVLIACEESQRVCSEFRRLGQEAYSCDIQAPSGGHPEWHIMGDALKAINGGEITTMDGKSHYIDKWDLLIAHPPCTYLSNVAGKHFLLKYNAPEKVIQRWKLRAIAAVFFMQFAMADIEHICVENPVGFMNSAYAPATQSIDPYMFAESQEDKEQYVTKRTCLWLKRLPLLKTNGLPRPNNHELFGTFSNGKAKTWEDTYSRSAKIRSKTFPGIARAMAEQWTQYILSEYEQEKQNDRHHAMP